MGARLEMVEGLCGSCSQANALAYAQAVEDLSGAIVPPRAAYLRLVLAEAERVTSHLLNVADTLRTMGYAEREAALRDLRERILHALDELTGERLQQGLIVYGGVNRNLDEAACRAFTIAARQNRAGLERQSVGIIQDRDIVRRLTGLGKVTAQGGCFRRLRGPIASCRRVTYDIRAHSQPAYETNPCRGRAAGGGRLRAAGGAAIRVPGKLPGDGAGAGRPAAGAGEV